MVYHPTKVFLTLNGIIPLKFDDRNFSTLEIQKSIYILQILGLNFGYHFMWYTAGPYSPELSDDIMELIDNYDYYEDLSTRYQLSVDTKQILNNFKSLFSKRYLDKFWLELIASLLFIKVNYSIFGNTLKERLLSCRKKYLVYVSSVDEAIEFIEKKLKY